MKYYLSRLLLFIALLPIAQLDAQPAKFREVHWQCGTPTLSLPFNPKSATHPVLRTPLQGEDRNPKSIPAAPAPQIHVGHIERFFTHIPEGLVKGTCLAVGEHIYIYIENSVRHLMTEAQAAEIATEFDVRIYPQVQRWVGSEWRPGLDRDARVTLLLHDVGGNASARDFGGYFSPTDQRPTDYNSNRREMVFMDVFSFEAWPRHTFYSSLAHEFAHLVNWFQNGGTTDERWIEEGLASFVEWAVYGNVHTIFVEGYLDDPSVSLTAANTADTYYGGAFTLLLYLFENHGGERFIREFARRDELGTNGISTALAALGQTSRFADVFPKWAIANFVNDLNRGAAFGYQNLPTRYKVTRSVPRVTTYPTVRSDSLPDWGVRYITFHNLPPELEIAIEGSGAGALHAQAARIPNVGTASFHPIGFDENGNGRVVLEGLRATDQVVLMVTTTAAQSYRYSATGDGSSGVVVGPPAPMPQPITAPDAVTLAKGSVGYPSQKQPNARLEPLRQLHLSSNYQDAFVQDSLLYAASDWGLEIFDLADPSQPNRIGEIATPGNAQAVAVDGDFAYVADGMAGLQIIDLRQPASPQLVKTVGGLDAVTRVQIANGRAYVIDTDTGLFVFDQGDLRAVPNPQPLSSFYTDGQALDLWVDGDTVYLSDEGEGLQILDFGRVDIPAIVGVVGTLALDIQVVGDYAYTTSGNLRIVDIRNRAKPDVVATFNTPGFATSVKVRDGYAYLTDTQAGLYIVDVRRPTQPQMVGVVPLNVGATGLDVFTSNNGGVLAYVAGGSAGLHTVDVTDARSPEWLHRFSAPGLARGLSVDARSLVDTYTAHVYVADGYGGLKIAQDTTNDTTLVESIAVEAYINHVAVNENVAYLATDEDGVIILDQADGTVITRLPTAQPALHIAIDPGYAYVAAGELLVLDIARPDSVRVLARRSMNGTPHRIAIEGQLAYVAALDGGVQIFDISDPANPRAIGSYETEGNAVDIAVQNNRAYIADSLAGVQVVDVTAPEQPQRMGEYATDAPPVDLDLRGDYLYLLDWQRLSVLNAAELRLITRSEAFRFPTALAVTTDAAYVSDAYELRVFRVDPNRFALAVDPPNTPNPKPTVAPTYANQLKQNFPNPFNPETWIPFEIAEGASVVIYIYDTKGALIRRLSLGQLDAGSYITREQAAYWDGHNEIGERVRSGVYFYRLDAGAFSATRKMAVVR